MHDDDRHMYELEFPAPEVNASADDAHGPTLVIALQGYADAGQAVSSSAEHLLAALDNRLVASFNVDELIDYRSRRPTVAIRDHEISEIEDVALEMRVVKDRQSVPFLLLSGPEPDLRWNAFTSAVAELAERYRVEKIICLYSAPMMVPHTRPLVVSAHGNSPDLVHDMFRFDNTVILPGAAAMQIEKKLSHGNRKIAGYTAHVPHYVSGSAYPEATLGLLRSLAGHAELDLPLMSLEQDSSRVSEQLAEQVAESAEIQQVVGALEQQYDVELNNYRSAHPRAALPGEHDLPSADELGQEFEKFLAAFDDTARGAPAGGNPTRQADGEADSEPYQDDDTAPQDRAERGQDGHPHDGGAQDGGPSGTER